MRELAKKGQGITEKFRVGQIDGFIRRIVILPASCHERADEIAGIMKTSFVPFLLLFSGSRSASFALLFFERLIFYSHTYGA